MNTETETAAATATYDPAPLNQRTQIFYTDLERLRDVTRRARKRLERVKNADQHIACLLQAKNTLIRECLELEIAPETIAETILQKAQDIAISRRKLIGAIKRCARPASSETRKRIGRPPKNRDAAVQPTGPDATVAAAAATTVIAAAKNTSAAPAPAAKPPAKPEKPATAAAASPKDSAEREQRMRRKAPIWAGRYEDDRKYGAIVARGKNESDADYCWRMWHTEPPWSGEMPRFASELTETQWIEKCWNLKSPEERTAHQASLPTTAR
ncbi:MAG: hypothetical protein LBI48_09720 [Burkholderiaceae bacterium]|jgi:hypothetical protein|nr:hypothetical protein [Burkholderiaceae bacterium]